MTENDTRPTRIGRPTVRQAAMYGLGTGAMYAIPGTLYVALSGGVPETWGSATLPTLIAVELGGGFAAGALFGSLATLAKYRLGAVLVTPVALSPLIVGVSLLVGGASGASLEGGVVASGLIDRRDPRIHALEDRLAVLDMS